MKEKIKLKLQKIQDGYHLMLTVSVNEQKALMVLDTGASRTVFDDTQLKKYLKKNQPRQHASLSTGLGTNSMESKVYKLELLSLGKIEIKNFNAVVLDLSHINESYAEHQVKPILGVLGCDVLKKLKAVIDLEKKELTIKSKSGK